MCGIAGFLNPRNNDKKTEEEIYQILKKMNEVQRHRGPDDEGIFLENGSRFAFLPKEVKERGKYLRNHLKWRDL